MKRAQDVRNPTGDTQSAPDQALLLQDQTDALASQDLLAKIAVERALSGMPGRKAGCSGEVGTGKPLTGRPYLPVNKAPAEIPSVVQLAEDHQAEQQDTSSTVEMGGIREHAADVILNASEIVDSAALSSRRTMRFVITPCADGTVILPSYAEIIASEQRSIQAPPPVIWERDMVPFGHGAAAIPQQAGYEGLQLFLQQVPQYQGGPHEKDGQAAADVDCRQQPGRELLALLQDGLKRISPREHQAWTIPAAWRMHS